MEQGTFHIITFGCQMNVNDSFWLARSLQRRGFVESPLEKAEVVILNTCSVRDKPEQKVYAALGRIKYETRRVPGSFAVVAGCVAQQIGAGFFERFPQVRLVVGGDGLAMAPDAIEIHPGTPNTYFEQKEVKGQETAPFFADANNVVAEGSYYTQRQPHLPIEPDVGYGYMNEEGKLVIHSKSIGLHLHGLMIAPGLGLDFGNDMVMVQCNAGGTFGYKFSPTMEALIGVAVLATGRPCHLRYNYEQQQQYTGKRSPFFTTVRYAADKATGKIKAMEADWIVDHGPYSEFGDLLTLRGAQYIGAGYGIENIRGLGKTVCTNHGWGAAFRGYGAPESEFASEVLIDELAEKLGMDPLELRAVNCYKPGDTNPSGQDPEVFSLPSAVAVWTVRTRRKAGRSTMKTARSPSACAGEITVRAPTPARSARPTRPCVP